MKNGNLQSFRNPNIELCRFIAAIVIAFHHTEKIGGHEFFDAYRIAPGGWIFVEFFFILSGYFMTKHFERIEVSKNDKIEKYVVIYAVRKLLKIVPYAAIGIIIDAVAQIGCGDIEKGDMWNLVVELPLHFLLLKGINILRFDINAPLWYLTEILIVMPLLALFCLRYRYFYKYIASWIFPLVIYTVIFLLFGNIQYWGKYWAINCMMRAFADLMLGSVVYYLSECLRTKIITNNKRIILTIIEIMLFTCLVAFSFLEECLNYAMPCVLFSVVFLCIALSEQEHMQYIIPRKAVFLGQISTALYCLHRPIFDLIRWLCSGTAFFDRLLIAMITSLAFSTFISFGINSFLNQKKQNFVNRTNRTV